MTWLGLDQSVLDLVAPSPLDIVCDPLTTRLSGDTID